MPMLVSKGPPAMVELTCEGPYGPTADGIDILVKALDIYREAVALTEDARRLSYVRSRLGDGAGWFVQ